MSCPSDITIDVEIGTPGTSVTWTEPSVTDASGDVTLLAKTHSSGQLFGVGTTIVTYLYADPFNNIATCTFQIIGSGGELHKMIYNHKKSVEIFMFAFEFVERNFLHRNMFINATCVCD